MRCIDPNGTYDVGVGVYAGAADMHTIDSVNDRYISDVQFTSGTATVSY
jgi:hypothetical protein